MTRSGVDTRTEAQRVAFELFTTQGYEATSLREIAERLGISKAALYYHFPSKEDLLRSLMSVRGDEAAELLGWAREQEPADDLLERTVLRWVGSTSIEKLRGIRFVAANPNVMPHLAGAATDLRDSLETLVEFVAGPGADATRLLLIRMAFLSINSAVAAARGTQSTDEEIVAAARAAAVATLGALKHP